MAPPTNFRNGRYLLPSRNLNLASEITECEEAMNWGSLAPAEVFIILDNKNILHIFGSIGRFLGLKVYEKDLATVEIPKSIRQGPDLLLMGIPNCGSMYFLLIQLDVDFKPLFTLLESYKDSTCPLQFFRFRKIDVGKIKMVEEDVNFSLLDNETEGSDIISEPGPNSDSFRDAVIQGQEGLKSTFSSVVDDIFESGQTSDCGTSHVNMSVAMPKYEKSSRKRCLSDLVNSILSLQRIAADGESQRKRKAVCESGNPQPISAQLNSQGCLGQFLGGSYGNILKEANHGKATSILIQVVRQCFLFIKHGCLTSQMEALGITCIEDTGLQKPSADFWFRLPSFREDAWEKFLLCLGKPGNTHWDVKVYDEHFRDLWELGKGKTGTPWGSGVRIANTSDVDSHIRYGPDGAVLSYRTLEEDSVQKLVVDLQRLSKAWSYAMGMRRLLGVKPDERIDTGKEKCNMKTQNSMKIGAGEGRDRTCGLMGTTFRIEAVGLMSLRFIYSGSIPGSVLRFIVEWEPGKEGCTMNVSDDQLWPHTKYLEDFIDGGEVKLLLDCIRLTAGPLHALSGAIRPARMVGTASTGITLVPSGFPTAAKTNGLMVSQGLAQRTASSSSRQVTGGISGGAPNSGASGNLHTQNGSIVSSASRGPSIVPSSLLPTDVSVVLRSPYWIRIIYRKDFAVDMRCFDGDQVWLQPATPPKGGPSVGGSMPCPQFQSVIMNPVPFGFDPLEAFLNRDSSINIGQSPTGSGNRMGTISPGIFRSAASHVKEELNSIFIELENDSGYGGSTVDALLSREQPGRRAASTVAHRMEEGNSRRAGS